jgi:hypothetical protein
MNHRAWTSWGFLFLGCLTSIFGIVILTIRILALQLWTTVDGHVVESVVLGPDIDDAGNSMAPIIPKPSTTGDEVRAEVVSIASSPATLRARRLPSCVTPPIHPAHFSKHVTPQAS